MEAVPCMMVLTVRPAPGCILSSCRINTRSNSHGTGTSSPNSPRMDRRVVVQDAGGTTSLYTERCGSFSQADYASTGAHAQHPLHLSRPMLTSSGTSSGLRPIQFFIRTKKLTNSTVFTFVNQTQKISHEYFNRRINGGYALRGKMKFCLFWENLFP